LINYTLMMLLLARNKPVARNRCVIHVMDWFRQCLSDQQMSASHFSHVHVRSHFCLCFVNVKYLSTMDCTTRLQY